MLSQYLPNGTLDTSFGTNGDLVVFPGSDISFKTLLVLDDEKMITIGNYQENGIFTILLRKLLENGSIDTSFGTNGETSIQLGNEINLNGAIRVLSNGNFLLQIKFKNINEEWKKGLVKLFSDGSIDVSFGTNGILDLQDENYCGFKLYNNERILVKCGYIDSNGYEYWYFKRFLQDGTTDPSFGNAGIANTFPGGYLIQDNNRILFN